MEFTPDLVERNLIKTSNFSSAGPDGIPYIVLKNGGECFIYQLCRLYQLCLDNGYTPNQWKVAHITPVYKKSNKKEPTNYRPVSLTSCVCKLMESCVREVVWKFWSDCSLINSSQFGFIPNSSCVDQLLSFLEDITLYTDEGNWADSIYLDFSKAFNSVPHERLLQKLSALGLKENMYNWIKSFLTKRFEVVVVCGTQSFPKPTISGVPQGSCLGPLLFLAYINDIDNCFHHSKIFKYADDTKVYSKISKANSDVDSSLLQQDLDNIAQWAQIWQLPFNVNKCAIVNFSKNNPANTYKIGEKFVQRTHQERDLGVIIDNNLKPSKQVANAVGKAQAALSILKRTVVSRDKSIFLPLYKQLVRPHLEYATCAWKPYLKGSGYFAVDGNLPLESILP